ncbi:THAP-type domain-containing protein, partial [Aphis craccivora]
KGTDLVQIITECIKKLEEVGLLAVGIVCDQGSQNRKMFDLLGGTKTNPVVDINGKQICLILLKNCGTIF